MHALQDNGGKTFGLGRSDPHRVTCRRTEPGKEAEGQMTEKKSMNQPDQTKNQNHEENRQKCSAAGRRRRSGVPIHQWKAKPKDQCNSPKKL